MKIFKYLTAITASVLMAGIVLAANVFPTSLNVWEYGDVIEEDWGNALENTIGITNSIDTDSHDYYIRHGSALFDYVLNSLALDYGMSAATTTLTGLLTGVNGTFSGQLSASNGIVADKSSATAYLITGTGGALKTVNGNYVGISLSTSEGANGVGMTWLYSGDTIEANRYMRLSAYDNELSTWTPLYLPGYVGIATTTPSHLLSVGGTLGSQFLINSTGGFIAQSSSTFTGYVSATGFTGNASTSSAFADDPTDCSANQFANAIATTGNLTCGAISDADVPNTITASNYVLTTYASTTFYYQRDATTTMDYWETQQTARTADDLTDNSISDLNDVAAMTEITGDLLYYGLTGWTRLATSTNGYVLTLDANGYPSWAEASASGGGGSNWNFVSATAISPTTTAIGLIVNASSTIPFLTMTNSTTTGKMYIPNSATQTLAEAGQMAIDSTSAQLKYFSGVQNIIVPQQTKAITYGSSTLAIWGDYDSSGTSTMPITAIYRAVTLARVYCYVSSGTSVVIAVGDGTNLGESIVCTASGQEDDGTLTNNTFTSREQMKVNIGSQAGNPNGVTIVIDFLYNED